MTGADDAQRLVDLHATAVVDRQAELGGDRVGRDPGRPDDRGGLDPAPVGEHDPGRVDGGDPRLRDDLDAAPTERPRDEAREAVRRLAEDPLRSVDEHPLRPHVRQPPVPPKRVGGQLVELGDRLHAGEPGTGNDERQPARCALRRGVSELDLAQNVVAQPDRVGEVLQSQRVLAQPGDRRRAGDRSERDDEIRVGDVEGSGF